MRIGSLCVGAGAALVLVSGRVTAQERWELSCRNDNRGDWSNERFCDIREQSIRPGGGPIKVDAHPNGEVRIVGWDRDEIVLRSKVTAQARTDSRAEDIAREVQVKVHGLTISA